MTREEPLNGKRRLEIYLASSEDVIGKAGRPKGSTKAARAATEGRATAAAPLRAAAEGRLPPSRLRQRWMLVGPQAPVLRAAQVAAAGSLAADWRLLARLSTGWAGAGALPLRVTGRCAGGQ